MLDNVIFQLREKSKLLLASGKVSTGNSYESAANSLSNFHKKRTTIRFSDVDADFLSRYEAWMLKEGRRFRYGNRKAPASPTTIGMYLRCLRSIFNDAIKAKLIKQDKYPFKLDYTIPTSINSREPLNPDQVRAIMNFECSSKAQKMARDFWVFSYLCNGMNPKDVLGLRVRDIDVVNMTFSFVREKTKSARKGAETKVNGLLFDDSLKVIHQWGRLSGRPDDFIFPFLNKKMTPKEALDRKNYFVKQINRGMKVIADSLGLHADVTAYVARHSFCQAMVEAGTPMPMISQALGHASVSTTEHYIGRISLDKTRVYLATIIPT
jgi:integrase